MIAQRRQNQAKPKAIERNDIGPLENAVVFTEESPVAPSQMNPPHVDPVEEIAGIISEVPQFLGQMHVGVEAVRYVEDDFLADFPGFLA